MLHDYFEMALSHNAGYKNAVIYQISGILSDYWDWFQSENKLVLEQRNAGLTDKVQSTIAPVLERRAYKKENQAQARADGEALHPFIKPATKYYVLWKQFDNSSYRRKNPRASGYIKVAKPENIVSVVGKKCTWEYDKFLETEKKLAPLRQLLNAIHATEVTLITEQRKYVRRYHQQKEA